MSNLEFQSCNENDGYKPTWWERRPQWLDVEWYRYLLRLPDQYDHQLGWNHSNHFIDYLIRVRCRWLGHPNGQVYYNPGGYAPDEHCVDCGDEI